MLGMGEALVFLVIITKGETERSKRRMRVFAWRVDVSGGGRDCLVDDKTALLPVLSKYWTGRTGQDGESQTVQYCNIWVSLSMSLWLFWWRVLGDLGVLVGGRYKLLGGYGKGSEWK